MSIPFFSSTSSDLYCSNSLCHSPGVESPSFPPNLKCKKEVPPRNRYFVEQTLVCVLPRTSLNQESIVIYPSYPHCHNLLQLSLLHISDLVDCHWLRLDFNHQNKAYSEDRTHKTWTMAFDLHLALFLLLALYKYLLSLNHSGPLPQFRINLRLRIR